jgi:hypothetical protein
MEKRGGFYLGKVEKRGRFYLGKMENLKDTTAKGYSSSVPVKVCEE